MLKSQTLDSTDIVPGIQQGINWEREGGVEQNGTQNQIKGLLGKGPAHDIIKISCGRSLNCNTNKETLTCRHMIWIGPLRLTAAEEKLKSSSCWQMLLNEAQYPIYQTEFYRFVDKNFRLRVFK